MKCSKVDNVLTFYWCMQIVLLLYTTGWGWLTIALAGCILISIIISYMTNFRSPVPIYIQFIVTILYSFSLFVAICLLGWNKLHVIIICTIIINFIICGFKGRPFIRHRNSTYHYWTKEDRMINRKNRSEGRSRGQVIDLIRVVAGTWVLRLLWLRNLSPRLLTTSGFQRIIDLLNGEK